MRFTEKDKRASEDNLQPWIVGVVISMTVLSLVAVGLRMWSRSIKKQRLWWDDWTIIISMGWNLAVIGFIFAMYSCGMGIHADKVSMKDIVMMAKWLVVAEVLYAWNLCLTKISLLLMYYRIFHFPFFKHMAYFVGGFVIIWGITITFLFIFICVPVQKLWYPQLPGHCVHQVGTWIANAASTILTDLIILLLPVQQLWKLQMRTYEKAALTFTFGLGFFVVFASAYRFRVLFTYDTQDPTYTLAPTVGWTVIEMSAGLISACLPTLRPVVGLCLEKVGVKRTPTELSFSSGTGKSTRQYSSKEPTAHEVELSESTSSVQRDNAADSWFDDQGRDSDSLVQPAVGKLRPEHGHQYHTSSSRDDSFYSGRTQNPLRGITVRTEFSHITNNARLH